MSENKLGFIPVINEGSTPKLDAYKWGFGFKSVKGASTEITYGWKASGVTGLSTNVYVSPVALAPYTALGFVGGGTVGANVAKPGDSSKQAEDVMSAAGGAAFATPALAAAPFVATAFGLLLYPVERVFKLLMRSSKALFMMNPLSNETNIGKRSDHLMRQAAHMSVEVGAKKDCIIGNKYDYCTGSKHKWVNGESCRCFADKVEWYYADVYKYIQGTELKMEAKKLEPDVKVNKKNLTQTEVLKDKNMYAENFKIHNDHLKILATKEVKVSAKKITHSSDGDYSVGADNVSILPKTGFTMKATTGASEISSGKDVTIGSVMGNVTLKCGVNPAVQISAGETKINNRLSLGSIAFGAIPDVSKALAEYAKSKAEMTKDIAENKARTLDLILDQALKDL